MALPDAPIEFSDLSPFDDELTEGEATPMIRSAWARAISIAPCLGDKFDDLTDVQKEIVKDTLRGAILRWAERGSGAVTQRNAGDYGETLKGGTDGLYWPAEIRDLQDVCSEHKRRGRASTIPTGDNRGVVPQHAPWCAVNFAAGALAPGVGTPTFCDCGADLTDGEGPLWVRATP
ncbi:head-to-tail adaptor [Gordonia phage Dre3]|uniref:Head-to-tail adaptor n=1 Tax=Gordonia phage Gibbous TaxID=2652405 RepID=A0A5J6T3T6_9CAUD|nr:head-to-tail adaptor [Gordonia phage Gibbous]QFG05086.1 head-to-tail adaptor [Gordonia phage Gibbous]QRI45938.1 head-to-tail adaptor [Gordonia phage Dre3]